MRRAQLTSPYSGSWEAAFKRFYDGAMQSLVPNLCPLLEWLKSKGRVRKLKPQGEKIYFATDYRLSDSFGYRGEGDVIPAPDTVESVQGSVDYQKGIKGSVGLTFEAMKFGRQGAGAFTDVQKHEMKSAMIMMRKLAQVALWGTGKGALAKVSAGGGGAAATATVAVDETYDGDTVTLCPGTRWLIEGMKVISFLNFAAYAKDAGMTGALTINSIDSDTQITLSANNNITANYYLAQHHCTNTATAAELAWGSVTLDTAASSRVPQGMLALCDDGTFVSSYCGISESTYPQWKAVVKHNSGTALPLTLDLFYQLFFKLSRKAGSFEPDLTAWMNTDVFRELVDLLEHFLQYKPRQLEPGFGKFDMQINGVNIPIRLDHECPSFVFFLNPRYITFAEGQPPQLSKETGGIWTRDTDRKDQYEAIWRWIFQTFGQSRNKHGILKDISCTITSI